MKELTLDSFAGAGGASLGIKWAIGAEPDIAINHSPAALEMHKANHPHTLHLLDDVRTVDMRLLLRGRPVGALWASPDCTHFSRARGAVPVKKDIRGLAWVVHRWAKQFRPRVIFLENVREFADWGPLVPQWTCRACNWRGTEGQAILCRVRRRCPECDSLRLHQTELFTPDPKRKGLTFKQFKGRLRGLGYKLEHRNIDAADYGDPTHRRRLFLIARCDDLPIVWPEPTHGDVTQTQEETNSKKAKARKKHAGPDTHRALSAVRVSDSHRKLKPYRTAAECIDWSIPCPSIFDRPKDLKPKTQWRIAEGIKRYVLENPSPFLVYVNHGDGEGKTARWGESVKSIDKPLPAITGKGSMAICSPTLIQVGYSERKGQAARVPGLHKPLGTIVETGKHALVSTLLVNMSHGGKVEATNRPLGTVATEKGGCRAVVAAFLAKHFGGAIGQQLDQPAPTATARSTQQQLVVANLIHMNHGHKQWSAVDEPLRTITSNNHAYLVYSFLMKYYGTAIATSLNQPLPTITAKDRFGLVTVTIDGDTYIIIDIGMRMLTPRELARCQGFPDSYILTGNKTNQTARIGNSVCPGVVKALVAANYQPAELLVGV